MAGPLETWVARHRAPAWRRGDGVSPRRAEPMPWSGEFAFFDAGVLFRGHAADNRLHRHATVQLTIGLDGPVALRVGGTASALMSMSGPAWLVRPEVAHALQPGPRVWLALLEPQTRLARHLLGAVGPAGVAKLPASLRARIDATGPLAGCLDALRPAPNAERTAHR